MLVENSIIDNFTFNVLQLVESGFCSFVDLKNGNLSFRDIVLMFEYLKVKNQYLEWQTNRMKVENNAKKINA